MKYLSICSGIEAATVAWHPLDWEPVGFSEIEPFPSAVLAHHYPTVPNLGDMTKFKEWNLDAFDILVGGTPCQAFSVAGLRQSLDDARGNLSLVFCEMADHFDPQYILWENVPGVLRTKDNAFGCFLAGLAGEDVPLVAPGGKWTNAGFVLGPKRNVAWRILDAQYFGLAQRRRRVFVVACPRDGADPCEILFEREGVQRHSAPSREAGKGTSCDARGGSHWSGGAHPSLSQSSGGMRNQELFSQKGAGLVPAVMAHGQGNAEIVSDGSPSLTCNHEAPIAFSYADAARDARKDGVTPTMRGCNSVNANQNSTGSGLAVAFEPGVMSRCGGHVYEDLAGTLRKEPGDNQMCVAFNGDQSAQTRSMGESVEQSPTLRADGPVHVATTMQVRRLTPVECERLQGFPDGYTAIPRRNKPASECPDGPRYKALGNSMAVPCMRWIGDRIRKTQDCAILG